MDMEKLWTRSLDTAFPFAKRTVNFHRRTHEQTGGD
jgi:hypothetical protein